MIWVQGQGVDIDDLKNGILNGKIEDADGVGNNLIPPVDQNGIEFLEKIVDVVLKVIFKRCMVYS